MQDIANEFLNNEGTAETPSAVPGTPAPKETDAPFMIDSEERANWFLGKLANIRAEQARVKSQADARIKELEADYNSLNGRFLPQLESWAKGEGIRRKRKTVTLLQGTVAFTNYVPKPIITDYATALTTARAIAPDAITVIEIPAVEARTEEKLDDKVLFAAFLAAREEATEQDGSPLKLPGLDMSEARETVKLSFGKEAVVSAQVPTGKPADTKEATEQ